MLTHLEVSNFKSFEDIKIDFKTLNILVGANGSGKSNFITIFKFLKDIVTDGIEKAVSNHGGLKYLRNTNIGKKEPIKLNLVFEAGL
jgi:predicted ATPase